MDNNFYMLLWGGVLFVLIGLWMHNKDREQIRAIENRMAEKEDGLYEIYQSLEKIMDEMALSYQDTTAKAGEQPTNMAIQPAKKMEGSPSKPKNPPQKEEPPEKQGKSSYDRVIDLQSQGYTEGEIAKELGIGKGEVRLIQGFDRGQE